MTLRMGTLVVRRVRAFLAVDCDQCDGRVERNDTIYHVDDGTVDCRVCGTACLGEVIELMLPALSAVPDISETMEDGV